MSKREYTLKEALPLVETINLFDGISPGKLGAAHGYERKEVMKMVKILKSEGLVKEAGKRYFSPNRFARKKSKKNATEDPYPYRPTASPAAIGFYGPASLSPTWLDGEEVVDAGFAPGCGELFHWDFDGEE